MGAAQQLAQGPGDGLKGAVGPVSLRCSSDQLSRQLAEVRTCIRLAIQPAVGSDTCLHVGVVQVHACSTHGHQVLPVGRQRPAQPLQVLEDCLAAVVVLGQPLGGVANDLLVGHHRDAGGIRPTHQVAVRPVGLHHRCRLDGLVLGGTRGGLHLLDVVDQQVVNGELTGVDGCTVGLDLIHEATGPHFVRGGRDDSHLVGFLEQHAAVAVVLSAQGHHVPVADGIQDVCPIAVVLVGVAQVCPLGGQLAAVGLLEDRVDGRPAASTDEVVGLLDEVQQGVEDAHPGVQGALGNLFAAAHFIQAVVALQLTLGGAAHVGDGIDALLPRVGELLEGDRLLLDQADLAVFLGRGLHHGACGNRQLQLAPEAVKGLQLLLREEVELDPVEGLVEGRLPLALRAVAAQAVQLEQVLEGVVEAADVDEIVRVAGATPFLGAFLHLVGLLEPDGDVITSDTSDVLGQLLGEGLNELRVQRGPAGIGHHLSGGCQAAPTLELGLHCCTLLGRQAGHGPIQQGLGLGALCRGDGRC